jgi:hypothetical protein
MKCVLEKGLGDDFLSTITDLISTKGNDFKNGMKSRKSSDPAFLNGSISNYTKNLIMTFPVLCDNSLRPDTASMISKANERNIITMLQLMFSSMQLNGRDGKEILSKIHTNINSNMELGDYIDALDGFIDRNADALEISRESASILREMVQELKREPKRFPTSSFSERSLNDYSVYNVYGRSSVRELPLKSIKEASKKDDEIPPYKGMNKGEEEYYHSYSDYQKKVNPRNYDDINNDTISDIGKKEEARYWRDKRAAEQDANYRAERREARDTRYDPLRRQNTQYSNSDLQSSIIQKQLLDTDVKKSNEIAPALMIVTYNQLDEDGTLYEKKSFVAGVKSRLISVDSMDIIERIVSKNRTKVSFVNFIRATTGEIKFVRDFLFCVDQAKINAKNAVKKGEAAKMWDVLSNRSIKNNKNKIFRKGNDASSITTLIINQETVNIMKKQYDFDIEKISNARLILDSYNLLGIIIADESVEVVKTLYAGNDSYETQAYSFLEKESNDNSYKKVINLIGKMNGR